MSDDAELSEYQESLLKIVAGLVPANAAQVSAALGKLSLELQKITDELSMADEFLTRKTEEYGLAYDTVFLDAGNDPKNPAVRVTEKVREATARVETYELRLEVELAKAEVRRLTRNHKTLDRRIFVGQSQAATVRAEARTVGYGTWGS
jgi:hypothetical protein